MNTVSFSPDGKILASGDNDDHIKIWYRRTGQEICTLKGHKNDVRSVAFSPDGKLLASGGNDSQVIIWRLGGLLTCHCKGLFGL